MAVILALTSEFLDFSPVGFKFLVLRFGVWICFFSIAFGLDFELCPVFFFFFSKLFVKLGRAGGRAYGDTEDFVVGHNEGRLGHLTAGHRW